MMKQILTVTTFCLFLLLSAGVESASAQQAGGEGQIGYLDPQTVLNRMPEMKAVQQKIQNFIDRKQTELQEKEREFQNAFATYQQKVDVISQEAQAKEEEQLSQLSAELDQFRQQLQTEVQEYQQKLVGPLLEQISTAIDTVAESRNLSMVLNARTGSGDMIIVYASPEAQANYDITDAVMRELGI